MIIPQDHLTGVCKVGQGAACCRYVVADRGGIRCGKLDPDLKRQLDARVRTMTAQGDNCDGPPIVAPKDFTTVWYRTRSYEFEKIDQFRVSRFTDSTVWLVLSDGGTMQTRRSSVSERFWPTWEEARDHLRREIEERLSTYRGHIADFENHLDRINTLTHP